MYYHSVDIIVMSSESVNSNFVCKFLAKIRTSTVLICWLCYILNLFSLRSGLFDARKILDRGITKLGLGTGNI